MAAVHTVSTSGFDLSAERLAAAPEAARCLVYEYKKAVLIVLPPELVTPENAERLSDHHIVADMPWPRMNGGPHAPSRLHFLRLDGKTVGCSGILDHHDLSRGASLPCAGLQMFNLLSHPAGQPLLELQRNGVKPEIVVNHLDPDSIMTFLAAADPLGPRDTMRPYIAQLYRVEDIVDRGPIHDARPHISQLQLARDIEEMLASPHMRSLTWLFSDWWSKRAALCRGELPVMKGVLDEVVRRWELLRAGRGEGEEPVFAAKFWDEAGSGVVPRGFVALTEESQYTRLKLGCNALRGDSRTAFISEVAKGKYSVGLLVTSSPFPLLDLYDVLNQAERECGNDIWLPGERPDKAPNCWSGSLTRGGGPRVTGSWRSFKEVIEYANALMNIITACPASR